MEYNDFEKINYIAGIDVSNNLRDPENLLYAGIVVFSFPNLEVIEKVCSIQKSSFPYVSGLLAFREAPVIIEAMEKLKTHVDVFIFDGHGIAHPRKLGIASHVGVLTNRVTVGCAKSILVGKPEGNLSDTKGSYIPLVWKNKVIGNVVRTKDRVKPVYVSSGHKISLESATKLILSCTNKYRIPEPTRLAHQYANEIRINNYC